MIASRDHARLLRFGRALALVGLLGICLLAVSLFLGAKAVDRIARQWEEAQLEHGLANRLTEVEAALVPQVDWDDAVRHLDNRFNADWARNNIGVYLTQVSRASDVYILDASDRTVFAMRSGAAVDTAGDRPLAQAFAPLIAEIRRREAERGPFADVRPSETVIAKPIQRTIFAPYDGAAWAFTASLVQPDFGTALPKGPRAPIVITGRPVGSSTAANLGDRYRVEDSRLTPVGQPARPGEAVVYVRDASGKPLVSIRWTPRRPGTELLQRTAWVVGPAVVVLLISLLLLQLATRRAARELVRREEELRAALVRAEAADRAKSDFLTSISHELRTPLNSVLGALHLLKSEAISVDGARLVANALSSGQLVTALVNDILDASDGAADRLTLTPEPADLVALITSSLDPFQQQCRDKGLTLAADIAADVGWARVDEVRLRQCLHNLVSNAVKFTDAGHLRVVARMDGDGARRVLQLAVEDTGMGIAPGQAEVLFERFNQADNSLTRRFGGAGLGLSITRTLARKMGGDVTWTERPGGGSVFVLTVEAAPAQRLSTEGDGVAAPLAGLAVLLVDDNAANLMVASKILEHLGAAVAHASSGAAALEGARDAAFDVILMDIQMPGMDGVETVRRLRDGDGPNARAPVIALTANVLPEQCAAYLAAGMNGVASKPISPQGLFAEIVAVLTRDADGFAAAS